MAEDKPTGSTVPRRQLGRFLRELRGQARFTIRRAALTLEWSEAKMWRIESGLTSLRSHDVETMCRIYGAAPDLTEALMGLAKETKARGWWHAYGDVVPFGFDLYIGLEEAASQLDWYEPELVPGLFQTPEYARLIIQADNASAPDDEIERRVNLRITRQAIITRATGAPVLRVIISEAVLRRQIGGPSLMADQLRYIAEVGELPNVTIKVAAFAGGFHPGILTGQFLTLRFPPYSGVGDEAEPPTVYVSGFTGDLYLDKPGEVQRYDAAFAQMWDLALDAEASREAITRMAGEYARHT
ncbi:helix-turn-helix transcriptional regulator [Streptomyces sp. HSW2009]|uniref:helix-turn-helix domain-containing protein n=1 Tax=Streptomyces sp. HSW2009 TaxID=3142890 RepID=UPI0032EF2478